MKVNHAAVYLICFTMVLFPDSPAPESIEYKLGLPVLQIESKRTLHTRKPGEIKPRTRLPELKVRDKLCHLVV